MGACASLQVDPKIGISTEVEVCVLKRSKRGLLGGGDMVGTVAPVDPMAPVDPVAPVAPVVEKGWWRLKETKKKTPDG